MGHELHKVIMSNIQINSLHCNMPLPDMLSKAYQHKRNFLVANTRYEPLLMKILVFANSLIKLFVICGRALSSLMNLVSIIYGYPIWLSRLGCVLPGRKL